MNSHRDESRGLLRYILLLLVCVLAICGAAQQPQAGQPGVSDKSQGAQQRGHQPEEKITPEQAKTLFESVDEILRFASKDTGLPIKHSVKRKLASREEVQKYIEDRMKDDEDARRLQRSEVVLKKFALLPEQFELRTFLVGLLKEQVAGFYDSKKKTVYLLDWVEPEAQKSVLAHELTHALQDQNFGLEKWAKAAKHLPAAPQSSNEGEAPRTVREKHPGQDLMEDERMAARQAVSEGQAMVVLIDYMLAPENESVRSHPAIADAVMAGMMSSGETPLYTKAPMFLKQLLLFPYQYGLKFETEILAKSGTEAAFAGAFRNPPVDTRQILEPETYIRNEEIPLMPVPDFEGAAGKEYAKYDLSVMGEFDVLLLAKQYAGQEAAGTMSPKWRGGYYYAALKPGTPKTSGRDVTVPTSSIALAYVSKWANAEAAEQFAAMYAGYLGRRYKSAKEIGAAPAAQEEKDHPAESKVGGARRLAGAHTWDTEDGQVSIETHGDTMLVTEGFDNAAAGKIREKVFGDQK